MMRSLRGWMVLGVALGLMCSAIASAEPAVAPSAPATPETTAAPVPEDPAIKGLENDINTLKEDIFRSKARTLLLQEFLINTEVQVFFRNKAERHYRLKSALFVLDNVEVFKKEFGPNMPSIAKDDQLVFTGVTTPGRHELSASFVYEGTRSGGYTEKDYEFQVNGDFSFIANRGETTVVTMTAADYGRISKDPDLKASLYQVDLDMKVESARLANVRRRIENRTIGLMFQSGFLVESYQVVSTGLNINQQHSPLIPVGGRAWWWFHKYFGVEGYYLYSNWEAKTGINGQKTKIDMNWFGFDAKMRYAFMRSVTSPVVIVNVGYNWFSTKPNSFTSPMVRLSDSYQYLDVGLEALLPVTTSFGVHLKGFLMPIVSLEESPVQSGKEGNTKGYNVEGGVYWNIWKNFTVDVSYMFFLLDNDFTGRGNRTSSLGVPLNAVQTRAYYQGGMVGLRYEF